MLLSTNWLRKYVDLPEDLAELEAMLTVRYNTLRDLIRGAARADAAVRGAIADIDTHIRDHSEGSTHG